MVDFNNYDCVHLGLSGGDCSWSTAIQYGFF